jgi:hypothetical protein
LTSAAVILPTVQQISGIKGRVRQAKERGTFDEVAQSKGLHKDVGECNLRSDGVHEREPGCRAEVLYCTFTGSCGRIINIHES